MHLPGMQPLMRLGIKLIVPKHRVGVALVAIDEAERVFLLHHVFHPIAPWGLPAGWLEKNESPSSGILRELYEETGLKAKIGPPIDIGYHPENKHIGIVFLAQIEPGPITLSNEIIEAKWFSIAELPDKILPFTRESIEAAVSMHRMMQQQHMYESALSDMNKIATVQGEKVEK